MRLTNLGNGTGKYSAIKGQEITIVNKIIKILEQGFCGGFVRKFHGGLFQRAGLPDIYFMYKGKSFWFEVKKPGGDTTALQKATLERLDGAGAFVGVLTGEEDITSIILKAIYY